MRMTEKELENRLKKAMENTTPDVLGRAKSSCRNLSVAPGKTLNAKRAWRYIAAAAAAVFLLVIGTIIGTFINKAPDNKVFATVSIDVNPSLEIKINKEEKVLSVIPLNDDAKKVIGDMDFNGASMELTINALIGSMYRLGYLNDEHGTVLVSLDSDDAAKAAYLLDQLTAQISSLTEANNGKVIANTYESTADLRMIAKKYNVPESKASLIARLLAADPSWADMRLGLFSIETLTRLIASAEAGTLVSSEFDAPVEGELTMEEAFIQALALAGVYDETPYLDCRFEYDVTGWLVYSAEAALPEAPIARIKTAVEDGRLTYYIQFSTYDCDFLIEMPADRISGSSVASSDPRTGNNPIPAGDAK
ncbi:MAG: hypothetical protein IKQ36_10410 [Clostridia bacterium]|nr:hypothetical protein [Clostridia bacterium]